MGRPKKQAASEESAGAPMWMVTFSDCMNLLLTFFVLLVTFSEFGDEQEARIMSLGYAMQSAFGTPLEAGGSQGEKSMVSHQQVMGTQPPEYGSESPTDSNSRSARNGSLTEDLQTADYRTHKVFLIPSRKIFLGRGRALSPEGRYFLAVMAAFLKKTSSPVVVSENGPEDRNADTGAGLSRASGVIEYLISLQNLDRRNFSIAAESIAPPEPEEDSAPAYHRDERMLEIVLLEGSVQR